MNKFHKILPIMVVAILIMLAPIIKAEAAEGKPGQTVTVSFSFNEIRGLDGVFSFSDKEIFSDISYSSSFQGVRFNNDKVFYSTTAEEAGAGTITVTATIKKDAAVGSKCTITLGDINVTDANTNSVYSGSKSEVVSVVEEPVVTKEPAKPTATPASQSGGQGQSQNSSQNSNANQSQNNVDNSSDNQSQNKAPTEAPANNNVDNKKTEEPSSSNSEVAAATTTPEVTGEAEPEATDSGEQPEDSIEANADVASGDKKDKENKSGSNIWLILFLISLLANLLLIGFLLWRKFKKKAETVEDDTPIVDYDIDEDFDDDII